MSKSDSIRAGIVSLAQRAAPRQMRLGTVSAVDESGRTCTVEVDEGYTLYGVRLSSVDDADIVLVPAVGAWCYVASVDNSEELTFVLAPSAVEKVVAKIGDFTAELSGGALSINGGRLGGIVNVDALISEIDALKRDLNALKTAFNSWVVTPQDGGAKLKAAAAGWASSTLPATDRSSLEDEKIKH